MATMTRQHFQVVADILGEIIARANLNLVEAQGACEVASRNLRATNPAFDSNRFDTAVIDSAHSFGWIQRVPVAAHTRRMPAKAGNIDRAILKLLLP